jgi:hypothetical protein
MKVLRLCSGVSISTLLFVCFASACGGSSNNGNGGAAAMSTNPNLPGGSAANGSAGASGKTNPDGTSAPTSPVTSGSVPCGATGTFCQKPTPTCCTVPGAQGGMGMGAAANTFSCAADAMSCPVGTTTVTSCSSAASCGGGEVCCRTPNPAPAGAMGNRNNGTTAACATSCAMGDTQLCLGDEECGKGNICNIGNNGTGTCGPAPCTASSCPSGEICCTGGGGNGRGGGGIAACVAPTAGLCPAGRQQICATAADCTGGSGETCVAPGGNGGGNAGGANAGAGNAAGVLVCVAPACTPGSCSVAGQLCCTGGGNPACAASVAPTAPATSPLCPNNSRLFCAVDADCASVPGTACLPGGNGGQLSCRVPPCTPTSCAAGQLCCAPQGGGGGGVAACVTPVAPAADAGGAAAVCPGSNANNSRLVCTTDADCASVLAQVPGATCNAGQNANATQLTCRVPPPPPAAPDAGAGDAG